MIRVVIDTNILVSALLQPEGLPAAVLMLALSGEGSSAYPMPFLLNMTK